MDEPLVWNTLEDAARWLTGATKRPWTTREVLSAVIRHKGNRTDMKATPPRNTSFGRYKLNKGEDRWLSPFVRESGAEWMGVPLSAFNLHELLVHDETRISLVSSPYDEGSTDGEYMEGEYIFVDPVPQGLIISSKAVGISYHGLKSLLLDIEEDKTERDKYEQQKARPAKDLTPNERDSMLKIIIAMAVEGYRYDPSASKNDAVSEITKDLALLGISLGDDTVRKYLKQAAEKLPPKKPAAT